jgi:hypothetical protein
MRPPLDSYTYTRVAVRPPGFFAVFEQPGPRKPDQAWDIASDRGVVAHAELFHGRDQWGVRVFDKAPELDEPDLLRLVAHLLVWHAGARVETIDVVLARSRTSHVMVRVGGDYV